MAFSARLWIQVICAVGDPLVRKRLISRAREHGTHFGNSIHPSTILPKRINLGEGIVIAAACILTNEISILCYPGTLTLGIYPAHLVWLRIGFGSGIGMALSATLFSLLSSVVLIWLFQKLIITDYFSLGSAQRFILRQRL